MYRHRRVRRETRALRGKRDVRQHRRQFQVYLQGKKKTFAFSETAFLRTSSLCENIGLAFVAFLTTGRIRRGRTHFLHVRAKSRHLKSVVCYALRDFCLSLLNVARAGRNSWLGEWLQRFASNSSLRRKVNCILKSARLAVRRCMQLVFRRAGPSQVRSPPAVSRQRRVWVSRGILRPEVCRRCSTAPPGASAPPGLFHFFREDAALSMRCASANVAWTSTSVS